MGFHAAHHVRWDDGLVVMKGEEHFRFYEEDGKFHRVDGWESAGDYTARLFTVRSGDTVWILPWPMNKDCSMQPIYSWDVIGIDADENLFVTKRLVYPEIEQLNMIQVQRYAPPGDLLTEWTIDTGAEAPIITQYRMMSDGSVYYMEIWEEEVLIYRLSSR